MAMEDELEKQNAGGGEGTAAASATPPPPAPSPIWDVYPDRSSFASLPGAPRSIRTSGTFPTGDERTPGTA